MIESAGLPSRSYFASLTVLNDIEKRIGELAALLSDTADMLCYDPQMILGANDGALGLSEADWPTFALLHRLIYDYQVARAVTVAEWQRLDLISRIGLPPPEPRENVSIVGLA